MNIVHTDRYAPWGAVSRFHRDLNRLLPRGVASSLEQQEADVTDWVPAVDIQEEEDRFLIRADVPGVDASELEITMEKGVLSLQGSRETRAETDQDGIRRTERSYGRFKRSFSLPDTADAEGISADYRNGVLEISIPKRANAAPRRIEVKASQ